uniref:Integrase catalytic domain-containing protein n=1 Tax=Strongyloides papillosus TaxID=174720 RepID=A0A0N5BD31_STREA
MASNQIKLDAIPLDEFKGNSREYLDYLKKFFIINDINVKEDIEYVKRFLRIQSNYFIYFFFDAYKDIESWDRKAVEEFCSSLMSDFPNRSTNELTDLVTVDEYYAINDIEKLVVPSDSKNDNSFKNSTFPPEFREEDKPVSQTASSEKVKDKVKNPNISDLTVKIDNIKSLSETGTSKITWSNSNLQPSKTLLDKHFSYSLSIRENNLDELDEKFVESINPDTQLDKLNKKTDKIIYPTMYGGTIDSRRKTKSSDYCHNISSPVDRTVDSCHSCLTMRKFPYKLYASWVTATHPRRISSLYSCYVSNSTLIMLVDYLFNFMYAQVLPGQFSQAIIKFLSPTMDEYPLVILIYDAESALTSNTLSEFFSSYGIGFHNNLQPPNTQKITSIKYRLKSNGRIEGRINSLHKTFKKADLLNILPFQRLQWATNALNTSLSRTKNSNGGNQFLLPAEKYYLN